MANRFNIVGRHIGIECEPYIIAEAGINHNGELELAKKMILAAKEAGADAVKFQTFRTEEFIRDKQETYTYTSQGREITESQFEMFKRTEFTESEWAKIKSYCDENDIVFLSTPVSEKDAEFLIDLGVSALKVGSDDFTNIPLLKKFASYELPMIVSAGMALENEMSTAINAIVGMGNYRICLMLCTSEYPTPPKDVNALKLISMSSLFPNILLGLSDHTQGSTAAVLSIALGARVFEKHFTLDHNLPGPDHWFSTDPAELRSYCKDIRIAYDMLGSKELKPTESEVQQRNVMHRSVTAIRDIKQGEIFTQDNIALLRPGDGIEPVYFEDILGKEVARNIDVNKKIKWEDIK